MKHEVICAKPAMFAQQRGRSREREAQGVDEWLMGHGHERTGRYSEAGREIAANTTAAVNASETRKLRRAKFMQSSIGATAPTLNQGSLQTRSESIESGVRVP